VRTSFVAVARGVSCQEEEHVLGRQGDGTPSRRPLPICGILWRWRAERKFSSLEEAREKKEGC
jgi:hypothetical protein